MNPTAYLEICPFLYHSYSPAWMQLDLLTASDEELVEMAPHWSSGRDLLNRVRHLAYFNKTSAEPYNPNCFAQQFGLLEEVPTPY